ncbi:Piwi domain-containing protein [Mycena vulgaris]|nr:Piwi domain-containing protein [Mycena vulgaris]
MQPRGHGQPPTGPPPPNVVHQGRGRAQGRSPGRGEGVRSEGSPRPQGPEGSSRSSRGPSTDRGASLQSGGASPRGSPRGSSLGHGRGSPSSRSTGGSVSRGEPSYVQPDVNVTTVGVRRRGFGQAGQRSRIEANAFAATHQARTAYQYDVTIIPPQSLPSPSAALNMQLIRKLQAEEPVTFTSPAAYDGQRKMYTVRELALGDTGSKQWDIVLDAQVYGIRVSRVGAPIDTSVLHRFIAGTHSEDSSVTDARQVLDVALRMTPLLTLKIGADRQIFYPPSTAHSRAQPIGLGVALIRGYFQALRPALSGLLVNIHVRTRAVYRAGPLLALACEVLDLGNNVRKLVDTLRASESSRNRLAHFITGVRVEWQRAGPEAMQRTIKGLSDASADRETFTRRDGSSASIAEYFRQMLNRPLVYPGLPCIQVGRHEVGKGALVPMELCSVLPDQPLRTSLTEKLTEERTRFSSLPPAERRREVQTGLQVLGYGQSEYVREFGLSVQTPMIMTEARVLPPPTLRYRPAPGSREATARPENGQWSMKYKHFYKAATIQSWALLSYESESDPTYRERFRAEIAPNIVKSFVKGCRDAGAVSRRRLCILASLIRIKSLGINVVERDPVVTKHLDDRVDIMKQLNEAERQCVARSGKTPSLFFVVVPGKNHQEMYRTVKNWGDVTRGIPTQCMKQGNCSKTAPQLWLNVAHKVNAKLGGINMILNDGVPLLGDAQNGTMVMGADVAHPSAGLSSTQGSYAAVVSSVDAHASKYVATMRAHEGGQELILGSELQEMTVALLQQYMLYRQNENIRLNAAPKRIIFYRDGVSEGQFQAVVDEELPQIKAAFNTLRPRPKITLVVVVKRHHFRFFDQDRNCVAGTVVDRDVVHPTGFDFYLQSHSHGGKRGTSRPAHYAVLYDENNLTPDQMQALSFALCHVYARSNRAVSIPAPIHYADRVGGRGGIHFNPKTPGEQLETGSSSPSSGHSSTSALQLVHAAQEGAMYFA